MSTEYAIRTILEIAAAVAITIMILNEDKFIIFEDKLAFIIRFKIYKAMRKMKAKRNGK